jgi:hypothetical protein
MLGSADDLRYGACNLYIGEMKKGVLEIILTMADDGQGMGSYALDVRMNFIDTAICTNAGT